MRRRRAPNVRKSSGEMQPFDEAKLRFSLRRSGADEATIDEVVAHIVPMVAEGSSTHSILRHAWRFLARRSRGIAARYGLREALGALGPDGHLFERYLARILDAQGWSTRVGVHRAGRFVDHEIDVEATRGDAERLCECKYRNRAEGKVDVKVALYVFGRATDLDALRPGRSFCLATNSRFTSDAIRFGEGMGLRLLGWDHPLDAGLKDLVPRLGLEPVTVLTSLRRAEQRRLLARGTLLCRELRERRAALAGLALEPSRALRLRKELQEIEEAREGSSRAS
ncbi:MAG: restriction endonuclease [Planctomycetes bacterium]|nr:restriction endonuclease [Planctomycetota bacterium]